MAELETTPLTPDARRLYGEPNYVHLSTLRANGTPRNWVVWVGLEGDNVLVCTGEASLKAKDMIRNPAVGLSVAATDDPYDMAAIQGQVIETRDDSDSRYMDVIAHKYTGKPFPQSGPGRVCFVIAPIKAGSRKLDFTHAPGG